MRIVTALVLCWVGLIGCTSRNVTTLPKYQVGYLPNHVYQLKVDRELVHAEWDKTDELSLVKPGVTERGATWLQPIGQLPVGTQIQIDELRYETNITLTDVYRNVVAYGLILNGPHSGTKVNMRGVSEWMDFPQATLRSTAMKPDPALVEQVGK